MVASQALGEAMSEQKKRDRRTVVVIESETLVRPDGRAGIRLLILDQDTEEAESIVFEVNLQAISRFRQDLTVAEQHILQSRKQTQN
jgi:hypothetical protein